MVDFTDESAPSFGSEGPSEVGKLAPSDEAEVSLAAGSEMVDFTQRSGRCQLSG
jgi:hypothetical protein